jgi:hypothetical protein
MTIFADIFKAQANEGQKNFAVELAQRIRRHKRIFNRR